MLRKRIHLKRKIKFKCKNIKKNMFILSFVLVLIVVFLFFKIINKKFVPIYVEYASMEAKKIGSVIINRAVNEEIEKNLNYDDLLIIDKNNNDIVMIDFNPVIVNRILKDITINIQNDFKDIQSGKTNEKMWEDKVKIKSKKKGVIYEMPSGIVFNNVLLRNLGPKIPVKLDLEGDILTNINSHVSNYGINNALIEISVVVEANEKVIMPITTKEIKVKSSIPLFIKMIQGTVPDYLGGIDRNSSYYK